MNVLFLGYEADAIVTFLKQYGENVLVTDQKITRSYVEKNRIEFMVSYGYRHIIGKDVLDYMHGSVINLHISYLPWNRGADPNFWSFIDDSPKGVTIHQVDEGLDTGPILIQKSLDFSLNETLRSTYGQLCTAIQQLFIENWSSLRLGECTPVPQKGLGSFHKAAEKKEYLRGLEENWLDISIKELLDYVGDMQMSEESTKIYLEELKQHKATL